MGQENDHPRRIIGVEGTAGEVMRSGGPGAVETWGAPTPADHGPSHENGGGDEVGIGGLSGLLADDQHVLDAEVTAVAIARILLTTRGDIIYRNATVPARLPKGNLNDVLTQGANDPAWVAPAGGATKEFYIPVFVGSIAMVTWLYYGVFKLAAGGNVIGGFSVPADFTTLTHIKAIGIKETDGTIDWTANVRFGQVGEDYQAHSDSDTANGLAMTDNEIEEVDISAAFTGILAGDKVGVQFKIDAISAGTFDFEYLIFKYT